MGIKIKGSLAFGSLRPDVITRGDIVDKFVTYGSDPNIISSVTYDICRFHLLGMDSCFKSINGSIQIILSGEMDDTVYARLKICPSPGSITVRGDNVEGKITVVCPKSKFRGPFEPLFSCVETISLDEKDVNFLNNILRCLTIASVIRSNV